MTISERIVSPDMIALCIFEGIEGDKVNSLSLRELHQDSLCLTKPRLKIPANAVGPRLLFVTWMPAHRLHHRYHPL